MANRLTFDNWQTALRECGHHAEAVVYIGLAGASVRARIRQFYATQVGARAPHAGGWPVIMLESRRLWAHYSATAIPSPAEEMMVDYFVEHLPVDVQQALVDPTAPLPFANLRFPPGRRKKHGLRGVKTSRSAQLASDNFKSNEDAPVRHRVTGDAFPADQTSAMMRTDVPRTSLRSIWSAGSSESLEQ